MTKGKNQENVEYTNIPVCDNSRISVHIAWKIIIIIALSSNGVCLLLALFFYSKTVDKFDQHGLSDAILSVVLPPTILISSVLFAFTIIYKFRKKYKRNRRLAASSTSVYESFIKTNSELKIVDNWFYIESMTTKLMLEMGYDAAQSITLPLVLNFLEMKLGNTHQVDLLHELLHIRNNIVHKGYRLSADEDVRMQRASDEIIGTLKELSVKKRLE